MNEAQQKFGEPSDFIRGKVRSIMSPVVREFISASPFAVLSTSNAEGDCDASPKGGHPGFVTVFDEKTLLIPDLPGNKLFQGYENIESNPKAGVIFFIPGCGMTVRANGRVRVVDAEELERNGIDLKIDTDGKEQAQQALRMDIDEVYPHCPRALSFSRLWDVEAIRRNEAERSDRYWYRKWASEFSASGDLA